MSDNDLRFAKLVKIIEKMTKVIEKEVPEIQLARDDGAVRPSAPARDAHVPVIGP